MTAATDSVDYVVVGAGTAGCVVAARLSDHAEVGLVEAGASADSPTIADPTRFHELWRTDVDWDYRTTPQRDLQQRSLRIPRGRVVGGSGSINGMIHVAPPASDLRAWEETGGDAWSASTALAMLHAAEREGSLGGRGLAITQSGPESSTVTENAFVQAAIQAGFDGRDGRDGEDRLEDRPVYHRLAITEDGDRSSTAAGYLPGASRIALRTGAAVRRIVIEHGRATGVELTDGRELRALREVVLSAGAIASPHLLQLSGIGPAAVLDDLGIRTVAVNEHVGRHLRDHLLAGLVYRHRFSKGRRASVGTVGLFTRSTLDDREAGPDLGVQFFPDVRLTSGDLDDGTDAQAFTIAPTLLRPRSEGSVEARDIDPAVPPLIDPRFLSDSHDLEVLVEGLRLARRLGRQAAFADLEAVEEHPGVEATTDDDLRQHAVSTADTSFHPAGTCRFGPQHSAVVDSRLRVHGIAGLRVIDASVMPTIVSTNTNAATLLIAEVGARLMMEDRWQDA